MTYSKSQIRRISVSACPKCLTEKEDIEYWDTHQTMQDGNIWCVNGKS